MVVEHTISEDTEDHWCSSLPVKLSAFEASRPVDGAFKMSYHLIATIGEAGNEWGFSNPQMLKDICDFSRIYAAMECLRHADSSDLATKMRLLFEKSPFDTVPYRKTSSYYHLRRPYSAELKRKPDVRHATGCLLAYTRSFGKRLGDSRRNPPPKHIQSKFY